MFSYSAYNLGIHSAISLPELIEADVPKDVTISHGNVDVPPEWKSSEYGFSATPDGMLMYWSGVGSLLVKNGSEIVVELEDDPEVPRLRLFLLGAAIGTILHQRGLPVFHASSIAIDGRAIMFVGDKGWGKSTMAAFLHRRGHEFLADDVVALDSQGQSFVVLPTFPQIKLWPDALESLGEDPQGLPLLSSLFDKRHRGLDTGIASIPKILDRIYLLERRERVEIAPIRGQDAMIQLIRNLYVSRFGSHLIKPNDPTHFYQCSEIVSKVPVFALRRPPSLDLIDDIAGMVEAHVSGKTEVALNVRTA